MKKILMLPLVVAMLSISAMAQNTKEQKEQNNKDLNNDNITTTASLAETQELDKIKEMQKEQAEWEKKVIVYLKLTKSQKENLDSINKDFDENIEGLKLSKEKIKETAAKILIDLRMEELKKERESAFMKLLTPSQLAKYKELVEKKNNESQLQQIRKPLQEGKIE